MISQLGNRLSTFQDQIDNLLTTTLRDYLDPRDGRFSERVERLVKDGGDLESVMRSQIEVAKATLQNSLETYLGADIAILYRLWNIQVPVGFLKIKNSFVEEIEKTAFNLHKCFISTRQGINLRL